MHTSSYQDAVRNGISFYENAQLFSVYKIPCHKCGELVHSVSYNEDKVYTCKECKKEPLRKEYNILKSQIQLQNAIKEIKKVDKKLEKYGEAIEKSRKDIENECKFKSKDEIIFATILNKYNIGYKSNVKIDKHEVDFILSAEKLIVEIDGHYYHDKKKFNEEKNRDRTILEEMGKEWRMIRIKDTYLIKNIDRIIDILFNIYKNKLSAQIVYL